MKPANEGSEAVTAGAAPSSGVDGHRPGGTGGTGGGGGGGERGPLAWFARNRVAANLLFLILILLGALSILQTKLEVFPEVSPRIVTVTVPYPGANPEEVELGVLLRLEEAVADVEGIKRVRGTAMEGVGVLLVEAETYVGMSDFFEDVKSAIDRLDTLPEQAEEPVVAEAGQRIQVLSLAVYGDVDRRVLKEAAEIIRDDLQQTGAVSQITVTGLPPYEISIEVDERTLRQYGLTFGEVADAVRRASLDLPAGSIETDRQQILVRSTAQAYRGEDFERIVLRTTDAGAVLRVGDVARVIDGFEDVDFYVEFDGMPAALMTVFRIGEEGALNVAATVHDYVANAERLMPAGVNLAIYGDISDALRGRIGLMLKNAGIGLVLVVLMLGLFLDLRLAFWCAAGLVFSFVSAIVVLPIFDVSINMISLFAFILVLGIVVDDAIVVGENIASHRERGKSPLRSAIDGVREVAVPVSVTILTSVVAFAPMLFATGMIGEILAVIPVVVIAVLLASLVEALLILPAHLSSAEGWEPRWYHAMRTAIGRGLDRFTNIHYRWLITHAIRYRYLTVSCGVAILMVSVGIVAGGVLPWRFFPAVEDDVISARIEMPVGTAASQTERVVDRIYAAAERLSDEFEPRRRDGEPPVVRHIQVSVGGTPYHDMRGGPGGPTLVASRDPALGEVVVELSPSGERRIGANEIAARWRELIGDAPEARSVEFTTELVHVGDPVHVQLRSRDMDQLRGAADWLQQRLAAIDGVRDIQDDLDEGKPEVQITGLTPVGRALGLGEADVFRQVRGAFWGEEAQRLQRGRDEVRVFVRYPREQRRGLADLENLFIRLPDGTEAPLAQVATYRLGEGFSAIRRSDRQRVISVSADINEAVATVAEVNEIVTGPLLSELVRTFPGVTWSVEGEMQEQQESMASLGASMLVALVAIYGMLAMLFRSYVQPLVVMSAIPFGFVGAVVGHLILDTFVRPTPLSFISMFGVVALAGVVVNDSLILIDLINRNRMADGNSDTDVEYGVVEAGLRRLRPIFLTTVTTFCGLVPIIMETSLQAQLVIPMAVSLGFGVVFATAITLLLVPALYMIVEDGRRLLRPVLGDYVKYYGTAAPVEPA